MFDPTFRMRDGLAQYTATPEKGLSLTGWQCMWRDTIFD